ncbi:hypothetical protein QQX98_002993 [Neonectria punicea]|uniref:Uncharacterized protein n=1 Tax=Neonectria punicea TaxID=979145 RepID=A0ABR1HGL9_9HYPO
MGTFGATVASLLDTYTKCLSLLKGFRSDDGSHTGRGTPSELQSSLGSSLRSDRARVRRAYSSQLSQNGVRFEKGDGEVVRSLGGRQSAPVDYDSLLALSNGSSLNAVRTINELSSRVSSRASSSSSLRSVVSRGRQKSRRHRQQPDELPKRKAEDGRRSKLGKSRSNNSASRSSRRHRQRSSQSRHLPEVSGDQNRISILTMSSASTKLGEIRRRQLKQAETTYPVHCYPQEEVKGRKKWWKLF